MSALGTPPRRGDTGLTQYLRTARDRRQPSLAPVITGQGQKGSKERENKGFCETRNRTRSRRQRKLVNPQSPSGRNFPKHLCPAPKQCRPDTYLRRRGRPSHPSRKTVQGHRCFRPGWLSAYLWHNIQAQTKQALCKHAWDRTGRARTALLPDAASGELRGEGGSAGVTQ